MLASLSKKVIFFRVHGSAPPVGLELVSLLPVVVALGILASIFNLLTQMMIYCAFSENLTYDFCTTGEIFYNLLWYQFSIKLQKLYVLPLLRSQREFRLSGLGIIECSLRVLASVNIICLFGPLHLPRLMNNRNCDGKMFIFLSMQIIQTAASYFLLMKSLK